jgi:homoserine O-succinyltransferase/O-acetyltransferase
MTQIVPSAALLREQPRDCDDDAIVIGLINNMPDPALRSTERQFRELLAAASRNVAVSLRLFSLPELPRSEAGRSHVDQHYENIGELWTSQIDGVIVTGTEPRATALTDEPYWCALTRLIDWTKGHTISTIWSCLAAHAAVLHLDGIVRRALGEKLVGVFDCTKADDHAIMFDAPPRWRVPHSRYNDLPEDTLVSRGYRILSRSVDAGADMFVEERESLFVFLQGHLEYDPGALYREYRRDIGRFLSDRIISYPEMPRGYFDEDTTAALAAFREQALRKRNTDLLASFPPVAEGGLGYSWHEPARYIYGNWLSYLLEQKSKRRRLVKSPVLHAHAHGKATADPILLFEYPSSSRMTKVLSAGVGETLCPNRS